MEKSLKEQGIETRESIYAFLVKYITKNGYAPTVREIGEAVGLSSSSSVVNQLAMLEMLGKIHVEKYKSRAIRLIGYELKKEK